VSAGRVGVVLLNFGEPENPTLDEVTPFLERIFQANAPLERPAGATLEAEPAGAQPRAGRAPGPRAGRDVPRDRAAPAERPGARAGRALRKRLDRRGLDASCLAAFQFTPPSPAAS
jgi:ferrochelatase